MTLSARTLSYSKKFLPYVALTFLVVGCYQEQTKEHGPESARVEAPKPDAAPPVAEQAGAEQEGAEQVGAKQTGADSQNGAASDTAGDKPAPATQAKTVDAASELSLGRFVVATDVENREPKELSVGKVGEPVVAFLELKNPGDAAAELTVVFEHESGEKVGFIELSVPEKSPRYRTWGRTRNVKKAGAWTAIVSLKDGAELARKEFQVQGAES